MCKLKCVTVGAGYEEFYTVGKIYTSDEDWDVTDNHSFDENDRTWELEVDGVTVRSHCCDENSAIVATFEIVED